MLRERAHHVRERMDDPHCDPHALQRTYAQFTLVNGLLSGWRGLYRTRLRPRLSTRQPRTLLDVGCGGGDVCRALAGWAARDGLRLRVLGIDPDERAIRFATSRPARPGLGFERASARDLRGQQFDFVISNHLLHHLDHAPLQALLRETRDLSRAWVIHNDLRRSTLAYQLFGLLARPVFRGSFIVEDGLDSIRRAYTPDELRRLAPPGWTARPYGPFRQLLLYER